MSQSATFAFVVQGERATCSAFSPAFKVFSVAVVSLALGWAWQLWARGVLELTWASSGWFAAALCMMAYTEWHMLVGRTTLSSVAIEQTWVWKKRVDLNELAYAKLIRVRGLEWLVAPRLYTRTFSNKLTTFYVAGSQVLAELERLEKELQAARQART